MSSSRAEKGVTLVELIVALALSSLLILLLYRTFLGQQKTYVVQEQVFDMQQNARAMMARVVQETRMAGFGRVGGEYVPGMGYVSRILPVQFRNTRGETISYPNVLNRDRPLPGWLTIITAANSTQLSAQLIGVSSRFQITVDRVNYEKDRALFDVGNKRYISIDGVESSAITAITEETIKGTPRYHLTLQHPVEYNHRPNARVYTITAVSFERRGREAAGESTQPIAENIADLTFEYFDGNGETVSDDRDIRMVRVSVTAVTATPDTAFKDNEGYRTRQMASNVQIRNLGLTP